MSLPLQSKSFAVPLDSHAKLGKMKMPRREKIWTYGVVCDTSASTSIPTTYTLYIFKVKASADIHN